MKLPSILLLVSCAALCACQDASTASRDDGVQAAQMRQSSTSPLYEVAVKNEAQRLMAANPKLDRKEAYKQAYKNVPVANYTEAPSADELKRQKRAKSQKEFEKDLAKVLGK